MSLGEFWGWVRTKTLYLVDSTNHDPPLLFYKKL